MREVGDKNTWFTECLQMIPYFEKKAQEWDEKKAGLFGKIAKVLKNDK